jgi:serine/threonine protein kinase
MAQPLSFVKALSTLLSPLTGAELAEMSLKDLCQKMDSPFPLNILLSVLGDISNGMQYLHQNNVAHRDMNLGNFLVSSDFVVKVSHLMYLLFHR